MTGGDGLPSFVGIDDLTGILPSTGGLVALSGGIGEDFIGGIGWLGSSGFWLEEGSEYCLSISRDSSNISGGNCFLSPPLLTLVLACSDWSEKWEQCYIFYNKNAVKWTD